MIIEKVSASVKFAQQLKDGSWKSIELSAEGTINGLVENWQDAQSILYDDLSLQLQNLWSHRTERKPIAIEQNEDSVLFSELQELLQSDDEDY